MTKLLFSLLGVKSRILLLTILPLFIITTVLTSYLIIARQNDAREDMLNHAGDTLQYLSRISEIAIFTGDLMALRSFANATLENNNVQAVIFFDSKGEVLLASDERSSAYKVIPSEDMYRENKGMEWLFQAPVTESRISVDDFSDEALDPPGEQMPSLGWVQLEINEQSLRLRQQDILMTGMSIGVVGFVVLIFIALRIAISITRPLEDLSKTVARLESGELDARVESDAKDEMGALIQGVNKLANKVERSSEELHNQVEHATLLYKSAMQQLQKKNKDLQDSGTELVAANNAKDEFLARMSHELRTPLTAVLGYSNLLSKTPLKGDQKEYNHIVNQASQILLSTIDDILNFEKLKSNAIRLKNEPFDLEGLLDDVIAMHAYAIHTKKLDLVLLIDQDVPLNLIGDTFRIRQILNNLVGNAVKFTDRGFVAVCVSRCKVDGSSVTLEFRVKDTGIGIDVEAQVKMFNPFQQADTSITRQYGGSGLGLVIAKELVALMDGEIRVNGQYHSGTELVFTINLGQQERQEEEGIDQPFTENEKVVVYDSNLLSCKAIRNHLRGLGLSVSVCPDASSLGQYLATTSRQFSLLILNLDQTEWHKEAIIPFIQSLDADYKGAMLVISGLGTDEWRHINGKLVGKKHISHLAKPLSRSGLQGMVNSLLTGCILKTAKNERVSATPISLAGLNIVLAEDNPFNRSLIASFLQEYGATVFEAENGEKAVQLCREHTADLLVVDLHMPFMDGVKTSQSVRQQYPDLPIIALTADVVANRTAALKESGVNQVIYKPIDEVEFVDLVHSLTLKRTPAKRDSKIISDINQSILSRVPASEIKAETNRLIDLLVAANIDNDINQVRSFAHQLLGVTTATHVLQEIRDIVVRIDDCFSHDEEVDIQAIKALIEKLVSVRSSEKKP